MPKVSIIVPVYNVEKYITKCIESVINQTYTDIEILIVDDGSPDRSIEKIEIYNDPRIKILRKENGGLSDARNYGLERSKGEYIIFVDSDDWIDTDFLSNCINYLDNNQEIDLIILGYIKDYEDKNEKTLRTQTVIPIRKNFIVKDLNLEFNSQNIDLMGYTVNKIYRKSIISKGNHRFLRGITLVEDALFNFNVLKDVKNILFLDKAYYHYRIKPVKTLMSTFRKDPFHLILKKTEALNELLEKWMFSDQDINRAMSVSIVDGLIYCFSNTFILGNTLKSKDQKDYIKSLLNNDLVEKYIEYYPEETFQRKVFKNLIKQKKYYPIKAYYKFRELIRNIKV